MAGDVGARGSGDEVSPTRRLAAGGDASGGLAGELVVLPERVLRRELTEPKRKLDTSIQLYQSCLT